MPEEAPNNENPSRLPSGWVILLLVAIIGLLGTVASSLVMRDAGVREVQEEARITSTAEAHRTRVAETREAKTAVASAPAATTPPSSSPEPTLTPSLAASGAPTPSVTLTVTITDTPSPTPSPLATITRTVDTGFADAGVVSITETPTPEPEFIPVRWRQDYKDQGPGICGHDCETLFIPRKDAFLEIEAQVLPLINEVPRGSWLRLDNTASKVNWVINIRSPQNIFVGTVFVGGDPQNDWAFDGRLYVGILSNNTFTYTVFSRYSDGSYRKQE